MNPKKLMLEGATSVASQLYVDDVFSTYTYTGTASGAVVNNGLDLASGGMVWVKSRSDTNIHYVCDSERVGKFLNTNSSGSEVSSTGLSLGSAGFTASGSPAWGGNGINYASWSFKKAPKFFDVVTYTGDGVNGRQIPHDLGIEPGMVIVKRLDSTSSWLVQHKEVAITKHLLLNSTAATATNSSIWNDTTATSTAITVGTYTNVNESGGLYVAYLFAHDPSEDGIIQCGSYVGTATGPIIDLGWEPQYLLIKNASNTGAWNIIDSTRGMVSGDNDSILWANFTSAEGTSSYLSPTATGFKVNTSLADFNTSGSTYIYMAIRRPNKPPQSGSEVLSLVTLTGNGTNTVITTGIHTDSLLTKMRNGTAAASWASRLTGDKHLITSSTAAEASSYLQEKAWDVMDGVKVQSSLNSNLSTYVNYAFKRAPGFFDVVCYTGTGVARAVSHGLGAVPQLIITKCRSTNNNWETFSASLGLTSYLRMNTNGAAGSTSLFWGDSVPTDAAFSLGIHSGVNGSGSNFIAYLFASLHGISKVGSYIGNGTTQTIDCGFSTGARFILVKRTDSAGDWYVWDSARGIVADNDPHLSLNTTAAEVTTDDSVDPATVGFSVNQLAATNINVSAGQYIYLAIA